MKSKQELKRVAVEGLPSVPAEYHTLIIDLAAQQSFNLNPTWVRAKLYYKVKPDGKSVQFLEQVVRYTDQPACLAIAWQLKYLRGIFRVKNKIAKPKKIVLRIHNLLTYLVLTGQITEVYEFEQRTLRDKLKNFLKFTGNPDLDIEYVEKGNEANRFIDQERPIKPVNINITSWETGEKYLEIFQCSMQNRKGS